jgi:hypothetical protein
VLEEDEARGSGTMSIISDRPEPGNAKWRGFDPPNQKQVSRSRHGAGGGIARAALATMAIARPDRDLDRRGRRQLSEG